MKTILAYHRAKFLLSVNHLRQLPEDAGAEVAFIGRSNAGKSSALNALTKNRQLAKVSKTPGRTQMINFFEIDPNSLYRLVDLPGYGYAKVPQAVQEKWEKLLSRYLEIRQSLRGLVLLMDIRHPLKTSDLTMMNWTSHAQLPIHLLLTKADKVSQQVATKTLKSVKQQIADYGDLVSVQLFSATKPSGIAELEVKLDSWLIPESF